MPIFKAEHELLLPVAKFLRRRSFRYQSEEMPFFEYRIDLYSYSTAQSISATVELKLRRWNRAFEQALVYQLCANLAYVALPLDYIDSVDRDLFIEHGIGLIGVTPNRCNEIVRPVQSPAFRSDYSEIYRDTITGRA